MNLGITQKLCRVNVEIWKGGKMENLCLEKWQLEILEINV